jgi:hypothetical protein
VPATLTAQPTVGVGVPLTVNVTFAVLPVGTVTLVSEAEICGTPWDGGVEEATIFAITDVVAEPAAFVAVQAIVAWPPAGTVLGAV